MTSLNAVIDLRLAAYRTGGIARYATELYEALSRRKDVQIHAVRSRSDLNSRKHDLRFRTPPHHRLERYSLAVELTLARHVPDVYHATDFIVPRIPRVATVATVHDLAFLQNPDHLEAVSLAYYRQIEVSRAWTDAWVTPSQWTATELTRLLDIDPDLIAVVPHGIPQHLTHQTIIPRDARNRFLLAVGTVEPRKRYDLLLDALDRIELSPRLEIVGSPGWNSATIEARLGSTENVIWRRDVSDSELRDLYRNAYAVMIPSLTEGFGFAALEAMAAGTPVISSGHGALPEVTGLATLTPESDDPDGWAAAIERIVDDEPLWNELSVFGRRQARHFSWDIAAEQTVAVYRAARRE